MKMFSYKKFLLFFIFISWSPSYAVSEDNCLEKYKNIISAFKDRNRVCAIEHIKTGKNLDIKTHDGNTTVMYAVVAWDKELLQLLLEMGADPHIEDPNGVRAIDSAYMLSIEAPRYIEIWFDETNSWAEFVQRMKEHQEKAIADGRDILFKNPDLQEIYNLLKEYTYKDLL